ncbi:MAG: hypothetical protein RL264_581 [Bacteroidota bacterium]|jgi:hypothetical protein
MTQKSQMRKGLEYYKVCFIALSCTKTTLLKEPGKTRNPYGPGRGNNPPKTQPKK